MKDAPLLTALAPWFGSARMNALLIGREIGKQALVGIPFCGGCSEIVHIDARQILLADKHRHVITLAKTVACREGYAQLERMVDKILVHPDSLDEARRTLARIEANGDESRVDPEWAAAYFANVWLSRSNAGTDSECRQPLAARWTSSGGSSVKRWRSAISGLGYWHRVLRENVECRCLDWREWTGKWKDASSNALYIDPPWQDAGCEYVHKFTKEDHGELADWLRSLRHTRVVIRHSDHPLYRELYPEWNWVVIGGRNQGNKKISECLIIKGESYIDKEKAPYGWCPECGESLSASKEYVRCVNGCIKLQPRVWHEPSQWPRRVAECEEQQV